MALETLLEQTPGALFTKMAIYAAPPDPEDGPGDESSDEGESDGDDFDDGDTSDGDPSDETYEESGDAGYEGT